MSERHVSSALRRFPAAMIHTAPLKGVEAQMYDRLWRAMIEGRLKPGTKLREDVIGETFGVSRTLVRKVLVVMEQEGIVHLPVNHGAYVATPTPEDTGAVHETVLATLIHIVRQLAAPGYTISPEHIVLLEEHMAVQRQAEEDGDAVSTRLLNGEFLILLAAIYGNPILAHLVTKMVLRYGLALNLYRSAVANPERARFQDEVYTALKAHDPEKAAAAIDRYFAAVARSLRFDTTGDDIDLKAILSGAAANSRAGGSGAVNK